MTEVQRNYVKVLVVWTVTLLSLYALQQVLQPLTTCGSPDEPHRLVRGHRLSHLGHVGRRAAGPKSKELEGYLVAGRSLPWWLVGLSVMATQLSAITMIGTTGQGYADGMRFLQDYYALPMAMIILSVTLVPFFHGAQASSPPISTWKRGSTRRRAPSPRCCSCCPGPWRAASSSRRRRS